MITIHPGNHKTAIKFWLRCLGGKPNGARTLGAAVHRYLTPVFSKHYDMLITYAADMDFEIPDGVKKIAVVWHQNFPWANGLACWKKVHSKLYNYDVHYFCNEPHIIELIKEQGGQAFYLPRFIDTTKLPEQNPNKDIPTLWFGNKWAEFAWEFNNYVQSNKEAYWITHGKFGKGNETIREVSRKETLDILNRAAKVWAIGVSQLEARYLGAEIVSYRDLPHPYYTQETIVPYVKEMLKEINVI